MSEIYNFELKDDKPCFTSREIGLPDCVRDGTLPRPGDNLEIVCRMGDPDLLQCLVYKREKNSGGIFAIRDKSGPLFAAAAESDLAYAHALGYFGALTANARYGVDVYENMEEPDD